MGKVKSVKRTRRVVREKAPYVPFMTPEPIRVPVSVRPYPVFHPVYPNPVWPVYPNPVWPVYPNPVYPNPACLCGKPLLLYIPPGQHAHPCPIHPEYTVYGPKLTWGSTVHW